MQRLPSRSTQAHHPAQESTFIAMAQENTPSAVLTALQKRVAREVIAYVRRERLPIGHHLVESHLAHTLNTSRTPVKFVLNHLAERGMLKHDRNRGFFLAQAADELNELVQEIAEAEEDSVYRRFVALRLSRQLPEQFTEIELMRQFDVSRAELRAALLRMQQEGWAEQRSGQGWKMLPVIDSIEAYEESFAFRSIIEPAGLLSPTFQVDRELLASCRKQQAFIAEGGYLSMTIEELYEANSRFHEIIAGFSGNRFLLQSLKRLDRLRRLVEYRVDVSREHRRAQVEQHLEILDLIEQGDRLAAADRMRAHLEGARRKKVDATLFDKLQNGSG